MGWSPPGSFPSPHRNPGKLDSTGRGWVSWSVSSVGSDRGGTLGLVVSTLGLVGGTLGLAGGTLGHAGGTQGLVSHTLDLAVSTLGLVNGTLGLAGDTLDLAGGTLGLAEACFAGSKRPGEAKLRR